MPNKPEFNRTEHGGIVLQSFQRALKVIIKIYSLSFARYLGVGALLFLFDLIFFLSMVHFAGLDIRIAQGISRTAGAGLGFLGHKYITFRASGKRSTFSWTGQSLSYIAATLAFNLFISPFVLWGVVQVMGGSLVLSKIVAEIFLVVFAYLILRLIFRTKRKPLLYYPDRM